MTEYVILIKNTEIWNGEAADMIDALTKAGIEVLEMNEMRAIS